MAKQLKRTEVFRIIKDFNLKDDAANDIQHLVKLAKQHHSLAEHDCNRGLTDAEKETEQSIENTMRELAKKYGFGIHFDGDPRGFTVKLHAPRGQEPVWNTWGGAETGYGIGDKS